MVDKSNAAVEIEQLLDRHGLQRETIERIVQKNVGIGVDSADVYLEYTQSESWGLEESIVKNGEFSIDRGFGFRVISEDKSGFAYANEWDIIAMEQAAINARSIAKSGKNLVTAVAGSQSVRRELYAAINPLNGVPEEHKIRLLKGVDSLARRCDHRVTHVDVELSGTYKVVLIADSDGIWDYDIRPMVHLGVTVLVDNGFKKERGSCSGGMRAGYEIFLEGDLWEQYTREAVRIALVNLEAVAAPAGTMPVVLGNGWPAVMLHEAVGHGLEADFNRKGHSVYTNMLGKQVAAREVSIVDQGNMVGNRRGSLNIDDEGTVTQKTMLIENGVLCSYMYDKLNAKLMHTSSTGNGRRASYAAMPLPRMTNTYMLNGKYSPDEIIASIERGIYAVNFSGGQVDITSGEFVFSTSEAYLIENGCLGAPIKGVTLIGNGPKVLHNIAMVGNDLAMDRGVGVCGKQGQSVAVGVGQPTIKISQMTVGGSAIGG